MTNIEIRQAIKNAKIKYWQVAEKMGINDGNFSRKLRKELPESEKTKILEIIENIKVTNAI
ncbi:MAG: hypothetical protein J6A49_02970 [Clostridia bacterium]|nr:hypothetical protein [Clostridia bacterium]